MALALYFRVGAFGLPSAHGPWPVLKGGGCSGPVSLSPPSGTSQLLTMGVMVAVAVGRMSLFTLDRGPQIGKTARIVSVLLVGVELVVTRVGSVPPRWTFECHDEVAKDTCATGTVQRSSPCALQSTCDI